MPWSECNQGTFDKIDLDNDLMISHHRGVAYQIQPRSLIIRNHYAGKTLPFTVFDEPTVPLKYGDSESFFNYNLKNHPEKINSRYINDENPITYIYNSHGYRTAELDTFKDNEFFLAIGCSYTEGIALHVEDIWASRMSEALGIPCCNLGLAGHGLDSFNYNIQQWFNLGMPKPKFVIIQATEETRNPFYYYGESKERKEEALFYETRSHIFDGIPCDAPNHPITVDSDWYINRGLLNQGQLIKENYTDYLQINNLLTAHNIPVIFWSFGEPLDTVVKYFAQTNDVKFCRIGLINHWLKDDYARDLAHHGPKTHEYISESLLEFYRSNNLYDEYPKF